MGLIQPTSESKFIANAAASIVMPCSKATVINQGSRVKMASNLITPTTACTDAWIGVADFANPPSVLGDTVDQGKVLLKDNVVYFDAPLATDTFEYGEIVYALTTGGDHYSGGVTLDGTTGTPVAVGRYVGAAGVVGGVGVKVAVKILPTDVI